MADRPRPRGEHVEEMADYILMRIDPMSVLTPDLCVSKVLFGPLSAGLPELGVDP